MRRTLTLGTLALIPLVCAGCQQSSSKTKTVEKPRTATFKHNTLKTRQATFSISSTAITTSATPNKKLLVLRYTFKNLSKQPIVPNDLWTKYVTATQDGKDLTTGNLSFSTSQSADNTLINRSVMPVKSGKSVKTLATFEPKKSTPITVHFYDTHHQQVGTKTISAK